ncbi:FdhF/YdeP family oxidoreductase [Actinocorallia sp. A-T 12471]|uniref:FdhF/YdeP family oxidoreductase n=1 Tax=Actinocorallia sp. A-T 12471 TaxID=3089813 RepID=UPI0029CDBE95|nr:FdhF/YdeP family oxidoreductase [Actinocorallia sp. A-T 12471]MDX6743990.1 FdhF/YdeP family oxidoreductase [Actinocorallia sp. A-T 12471]
MSERDAPEARDEFGIGTPGERNPGRGPGRGGGFTFRPDTHPTAGWGAARAVGEVLARTREPLAGTGAILKMNHEDGGFDCPGCAWPDDQHGLRLDICENGVKHATWEMTHHRAGPDFFAAHTVAELRTWSDHALEAAGRLTEPLAYDPASDRYLPVGWDAAFAMVGEALRGLDSPRQAAFYTSGRLSNEASFLYQLWVREFGTNNLPDCSNMCHEASGKALTASIGTNKGTVDLDDFDKADAIFLIGSNAASNAPRMLTALAKAYRRGAQIVHVNPMVEAASRRTIVPHEFVAMGTLHATPTGTMSIQPRIAGDQALLRGMAKALLEMAESDPAALDTEFLARHTDGLAAYRSLVAATPWSLLVEESGVPEAVIRAAARVYRRSRRTIIAWCLGVTQQEHGVDTIREIANVLLLRGNIGTEGAGACPIRGHSNVQGNRTCGIDHHPGDDLLDRLGEVCGITPPRGPGLDVVGTLRAMRAGDLRVFVALGGNFALAVPDTVRTAESLRGLELTVQVSTKLNRSHLEHGRAALILPCLGRTERDVRPSGPQGVTVEDSMSMVHFSVGRREPASDRLLSEPAIIAGMARATLPGSATPWETYADDYDRIRDTMSHVLYGFEDFNRRVRRPHGFRLAQPARERVWRTPSGRAEFHAAPLTPAVPPPGHLVLATVRSHDQWNTTIYTDNDRYRGLANLRTVLFLNRADMAERDLAPHALVDITSIARDGTRRTVHGYTALPYDLPRGSAVGYMPELNVLCAADDYSSQSDQPLMKHVLITLEPSRAGVGAEALAAERVGGLE